MFTRRSDSIVETSLFYPTAVDLSPVVAAGLTVNSLAEAAAVISGSEFVPNEMVTMLNDSGPINCTGPPLNTNTGTLSPYASPTTRTYTSPTRTYASPTRTYASPTRTYASPTRTYTSPTRTYTSSVNIYTSPAVNTCADLLNTYSGSITTITHSGSTGGVNLTGLRTKTFLFILFYMYV